MLYLNFYYTFLFTVETLTQQEANPAKHPRCINV